jgi:hypothetical protein
VPAAVTALVPAAATAAPPKQVSATGTIRALQLRTITVKGTRTLTCAIGARSTLARGYGVGSRVRITCVNGVLSAIDTITIARPKSAAGASTGATAAVPAYVVLSGPITALGSGSITVGGKITCAIGPSSPPVASFKVGEPITGRCEAGTLTALTRSLDA